MKRLFVLAATLATMWAQGTQAAIIVSLDGIPANPGPAGVWNWIYRATLQPDQSMLEQDFFTIYDFPGLTGSGVSFGPSPSPAVSGRIFETSVQNLGVNPPSTAIPDDPLIPNVTVKLTGGGTIDPANDPGPGPVTLGTLLIQTTTNLISPITSFYGGLAHVTVGGASASNVGSVPVAAIPEPGSVIMMLVGLIALGAFSSAGVRMRSELGGLPGCAAPASTHGRASIGRIFRLLSSWRPTKWPAPAGIRRCLSTGSARHGHERKS